MLLSHSLNDPQRVTAGLRREHAPGDGRDQRADHDPARVVDREPVHPGAIALRRRPRRSALGRTAWAQDCAIVTVAHRISTARDAGRVVVLEAGRIAEQGAPGDLVSAGGRFAALAALDEAGWDWSGPTGP